MGDTGSLALGGALGAVAVATHHEFVLVIIGGLFVLEARQRHHPGLLVSSAPASASSGWRRSTIISSISAGREPTVVIRFWIISFILALAGLSTLKLQVITAKAFAGKHYAVSAWRGRGLATVEALLASGARGHRLGRSRRKRRGRRRSPARRRARRSRLTSGPQPSSTPSSSRRACRSTATRSRKRARDAGVEIIGDIELFARARPELAAAQGGRDHRHQRQVDHHRARPPHPQDRGRADDDGRQYRPADPRAGPAARRRRLCAGAVELPDRPDPQPRLRRRGAAQHHARPSRPL